MKKSKDKDRYVLRLKFWTEGEESNALEGTMTTDSLRKARNEFSRTFSRPPCASDSNLLNYCHPPARLGLSGARPHLQGWGLSI